MNLDADDGDYVPSREYQQLLRYRIGGHQGGIYTSPPRVGYAAVLLLTRDRGARRRPLNAHFGIPRAAVPPQRLRGRLPPPILGAIRLRLVKDVRVGIVPRRWQCFFSRQRQSLGAGGRQLRSRHQGGAAARRDIIRRASEHGHLREGRAASAVSHFIHALPCPVREIYEPHVVG